METNIAERLEIQVDDESEIPPRTHDAEGKDRLAAFRSIEAGERPTASSSAAAPVKKGRRNALMMGASAVAVLAAGVAMFWISPYNHYTIRGASNLATHVRNLALNAAPKPPPLVAPAARLARAPEPTPVPPRYQPTPPTKTIAGDDMAEFLRLGGQAAPPVAVTPAPQTVAAAEPRQAATVAPAVNPPVKPAAALPNPIATEPAQPPATQSPPSAAPIVAASQLAAPAAAQPASRTATSVPPPAQDAVAKIAELRPAPMAEPQQVQVLQLVTELGTLVRDQRVEIAQLRQDQQNLDQRVDGSLTDFGRRLSLAEARGAVAAAMDLRTASTPVAPVASAPVAIVPTPVAARAPAPKPADATPPRYHVQAASPGLAMLSVLDASGGEEQQLPVSPGDSVPGWGKVISISQRGATWIVKTEHGLIQ
jgi:hypothetical protein